MSERLDHAFRELEAWRLYAESGDPDEDLDLWALLQEATADEDSDLPPLSAGAASA
jgi:hypothetical protein